MEEKDVIYLIEKYLAHQCTEEEKKKLEEWYESFDNRKRSFEQEEIKASERRSLKAIKARIGYPQSYHLRELPLKSEADKSVSSIWMAAASIMLLISVMIGLYVIWWQTSEYTVFSTEAGEVKEWKLPDGSQVWLNAGSRIKYPADYNETDREVYLEGEGFFDVVPNQGKPFIIHSGQLDTRVLGTAFSVSAYPGAALNTVTVLRGKVQVSNQEDVLVDLLPNKKIEYQKKTKISKIIEVDAASAVAWKQQKLVFMNMPMQDIAIYLQKWFGYRFKFQDQTLKSTRFTASFENTISLGDLLKIMRQVTHVDYRINHKEKTVTFL